MTEQKEALTIIPDQSVFNSQVGFENAQRMAKLLSSSSLIPKEFQGNIANTVIALEIANRMGESPLMVMQNLYVVHGKPGWASPFIVAKINSSGRFSALKYDMSGDGDEWGCSAYAFDRKGERVSGPRVTIKMAKEEGWYNRSGSKWKTMPELMLMYRSATLFGRLYAPDLLMGMQTYEEIIDIETTAPQATRKQGPTSISSTLIDAIGETDQPAAEEAPEELPPTDAQPAATVETPVQEPAPTIKETPVAPANNESTEQKPGSLFGND